MEQASDPLAAEREFFTALVEARPEALDRVLADDFVLIDVMRGAEVTKAALLAVIGSGQLRFEVIEPAEQRVRLYPATAVVTGRTRMSGRFGGALFAALSRYTHVYVEQQGRWRLVAAQGTPIAPEPEQPAA
jgi:ketosteroid isomerase-like protein